MYLSKYIRRCDFMDNMNTMDFNQKIDVSLRASLEATPVERNASDDLSTGSSSDGFWNLIVLYTGSPQTLQNEFPSSSFTFLLGNYAIVKISEDDIPSLAAFPQVIYIERPRQLFFEIVSARQASCLSAIQENSSYGLTGKGILISVIDSGIDYAHPDFAIRTKPHGWLLSGTRPSSLILLLDALPPPVIHRVHFFLRNRSMWHFRQTLLSSAWNLYPAQMSQGTEPMSPVLLPETAVPPADSTAELPRNPHFLPSNSARPIQRDFQTRSN